MRLRRPARARAVVALGAVGLLPLTPLFPAGPASAEPGAACNQVTDVEPGDTEPSTQPNLAAIQLRVADAQQYVRDVTGDDPGSGVGVAVVGSGVVPIDQIPTVGTNNRGTPELWDATGVAGVVVGAPNGDVEGATGDSGESADIVGWAPAATLFNVQAFSTEDDESEGGTTPDVDTIVGALDAVAEGSRENGGLKIVVLAFSLPESGKLKRAVEDLSDAGLVVVAPAGDVVVDTVTEESDEESEDSDETGVDYPAAYSTEVPGVVAVTSAVSSGTDASSVLKLGPQIDVAAPTSGAVSYAINGLTCDVVDPSSTVAAGEVAGLLALLAQVYPKDSAEELIARLEDTATGTVSSGGKKAERDAPVDPTLGRGIIQPLDALERLSTPQRGGTTQHNAPPEPDRSPVALPQPAPDRLSDIRDNAVWWGLIGGGAVLVAAVLRPVIARRRRDTGA